MLLQRAFTLGTPRRVSASSITSSWYSDPRWTSSTATAPVIAASVAGPTPWAAYPVQRVSAGRRRFPPAFTRWAATSPRKGSSDRTAAASSVSTRSRSVASGSSPSAASGCICAGYGVVGTNSKPEASFFFHTSWSTPYLQVVPRPADG